MFDGDTIFAMACGTAKAELSVVGLMAARAMERAVVKAVEHATALFLFPPVGTWLTEPWLAVNSSVPADPGGGFNPVQFIFF